MVRVLIVDDHAGIRSAMRRLLAGTTDLEVVGESEDGWAAVKLAEEVHPDVVVMDISMPRLGGVEATFRLRRDNRDTHIVIVTAATDPVVLRRARAAGADAIVSKDEDPREILSTIRRLSALAARH